MMVNFKLVAKFVWCGLIAPFFGMVAIIILLPILLPLAMVGIGVLALHERWDEFKRTEAAASSRATNGVRPVEAPGEESLALCDALHSAVEGLEYLSRKYPDSGLNAQPAIEAGRIAIREFRRATPGVKGLKP